MSERWDNHFLNMAVLAASMSKDPSTKVGAVIVGPDREVRSTGFNGFPRGIHDHMCRLHNRETKYKLVVHAEMNAVLAAARVGVPLKGCTMYMVAQDAKTGRVWGGPPCTRCTVEAIQAGITEFVSYPLADANERWKADCAFAGDLLEEAGIKYREVPVTADLIISRIPSTYPDFLDGVPMPL